MQLIGSGERLVTSTLPATSKHGGLRPYLDLRAKKGRSLGAQHLLLHRARVWLNPNLRSEVKREAVASRSGGRAKNPLPLFHQTPSSFPFSSLWWNLLVGGLPAHRHLCALGISGASGREGPPAGRAFWESVWTTLVSWKTSPGKNLALIISLP